MFSRIRAVHVAVKSVDDAVKEFSENFNLSPSRSGEMPEMGIRNALLPLGDAFIEFIEPLDPEKGPLAQFLKNRGEGLKQVSTPPPRQWMAFKPFPKNSETKLEG